MELIYKNETWELSDLPEGKKAIDLKSVFKSKYNSNGSLLRKKVRIVAKEYSQVERIDYEEVFSPVARMKTVCLFLTFGTQRRWKINLLDIKTAFLNGDLMDEVYVCQPKNSSSKRRKRKCSCFVRLCTALSKLRELGLVGSTHISSRWVSYKAQTSP